MENTKCNRANEGPLAHSPAVRQPKAMDWLCLAFGIASLLAGSVRAIPFLLGTKFDLPRESLLLVAGLIAITVLLGRGNRRIIGTAPTVPNLARSFGLFFAYLTLAGLVAGATLDLLVSAAFNQMLRDF